MSVDLSPTALVWCGFVLFTAASIRGYAGFGFSAVLMAGLAFVLPVAQIVPLSLALEVLASIGQIRGIFTDIDKRRLGVLLITGFVGTPIGVYLLDVFPDEQLRISILLFIFLTSVVLILSNKRLFVMSLVLFGIAGFVAGVVNGATALSGLVLALFFTITGEKAAVMRATMIAYFLLTDLWAGGILLLTGHYDTVTISRTLWALPLLVLGVWLGSKYFESAKTDSFRPYVLFLLVTLSATGLLHTLL